MFIEKLTLRRPPLWSFLLFFFFLTPVLPVGCRGRIPVPMPWFYHAITTQGRSWFKENFVTVRGSLTERRTIIIVFKLATKMPASWATIGTSPPPSFAFAVLSRNELECLLQGLRSTGYGNVTNQYRSWWYECWPGSSRCAWLSLIKRELNFWISSDNMSWAICRIKPVDQQKINIVTGEKKK